MKQVGTAVFGSSVQVEEVNRASVLTKLANVFGPRTALPVLDLLAKTGITLGKYGLFPKALFAISSTTDAPAALLVPPRGTRRRLTDFGRFRAEWVWNKQQGDPLERRDSAILYFHGGGFASCGLNTHRRLVAKIGKASEMPVFNVDYRQLPHHFVETLADGVEAYRHLLNLGFDPKRVVFAGDSAGGGLVFRVALAAKEEGLPVPGGIVSISPWADLDWKIRNAHPNVRRDPILPASVFEFLSRQGYLIDGELDPMWSSVNHDCTGMPPALIQVGSTEVFLPDAEQVAKRYGEAGAPMQFQIWDRAIHVHQAGSDILSDARAAVREIGAFNKEVLRSANYVEYFDDEPAEKSDTASVN
ncbi:putative carboxylesterase [Gordonia effusa NBRC 100432]|uniref:Putative carboxylesterase n=1 Tax=Gordonia effusa NBRC 100432 TaxID=1077974 RepID=H0R4Y5_9ACTN|nr:alpha/beta hydrolase fold domain-containing protein [Gordonia effusa]GAB20136.1 putative carboxylesterase [Gordonia effusa NBRC 100432]